MSEATYEELVKKTFIDNAIRSVVMIDDEYLRYDQLANSLNSDSSAFNATQLSTTLKAAKLHDFFRNEKKISCDIDNVVGHIDAEKIRKSDLVILDYQLEVDDPRMSIELIRELQINPHMNLVILYTREDLDKVWLQLAACLRAPRTNHQIAVSVELSTSAADEQWDDYTGSGVELPAEEKDWINDGDLVSYMLKGEVSKQTKNCFGKKHKTLGKFLSRATCEHILATRARDYPRESNVGLNILGNFEDTKWIQSGNVFVVLHKKAVDDTQNEPTELWDALTKALQAWAPSYYLLVISEMQNLLENESLPFANEFVNDVEGQAAWLCRMLVAKDVVEREYLSNQFFEKLIEELKIKLLQKNQLSELHKHAINALDREVTALQVPDIEQFSANHVKLAKSADFKLDMYHALNANLCAIQFSGRYITNGTVLREDMGNNISRWYLCVSPACDTVPDQLTSALSTRLKPDRLLKMIVLSEIKISKALMRATAARNIFVYSENKKRIALEVQDNNSHNPEIEYALVHDHQRSGDQIDGSVFTVSFLTSEQGISSFKPSTLLPICQLRDSYTARYQTVASHHSGRVGVDFVDYGKKSEENCNCEVA